MSDLASFVSTTPAAFVIPKFVDDKPKKRFRVRYSVEVYVEANSDNAAVEDGWSTAKKRFDEIAYAHLVDDLDVEQIKARVK